MYWLHFSRPPCDRVTRASAQDGGGSGDGGGTEQSGDSGDRGTSDTA